MNKKVKAVIIIEIFIVLGLIVHLVRTPHMWGILALAIIFTVLANRSRARVLRVLSLVFWAIAAMILFTAGWFWLAIVFPAIMAIIFWKNNPRENEYSLHQHFFQSQVPPERAEKMSKANGNDIIDLYDVKFKATGNSLSIKKITGNTKIIVPEDVAVILDLTVHSGLIKIFDETPKINAGHVQYFSETLEESSKRIKISIRVENGNIEVVRG